jgi:hypothetical protein
LARAARSDAEQRGAFVLIRLSGHPIRWEQAAREALDGLTDT